MVDFKTTKALVKHILEVDERARNSDSFLYFKVLKHHANKRGIDLRHLSVAELLLGMNIYGFPPFESVRRARQKLQAKCPELAACEKVEAARMENEKDYRAFALEEEA